MKILLTGATGNIGRFTIAYLLGQGHSVAAMVRDPERALNLLGQNTRVIDYREGQNRLIQELENADAVINLAGSPVATRWTKSKKHELKSSRIDLTDKLVNAIGTNCLDAFDAFICRADNGETIYHILQEIRITH